MIRKILLISFLTMLPFLATALPFNSKLTETDAATVQNGEVLIKSIDKAKNMAIESQNPGVQKLVDLVKDHAPNYLAEIIQVKPVSGNEDLAERLSAVLEDVEGYAGIPYWSVHHERYFDLYETAVIDSQKMLDEHTKLIDASIDIGPFGVTKTPITIEKTDDYLLYVMTNDQSLRHKGITCVKKNNMVSIILLFKDGDNWILYGIGGVKAPKIAMFEERIETSFINKTKTFCSFVYSKL